MSNLPFRYRVLDHTADVGLEVFGRSAEELFENAAMGFADLLTGASPVRELETRIVIASAGNREELLVRWLQELLFLFDTEKKMFGQVRIRELTGTRIAAEVALEKLDPGRHTIRRTVKGVTYHSLSIREEGSGLRGRVIFDL